MCSLFQNPRKRLRLSGDSCEHGETQVAETLCTIGSEDILSRQAILLVETTNDSVDDQTMAVVKVYDLYEKKSHVLTPVTPEMITGGLCMLLLNDELYVFIRGGKLFCLKDFWKEMSPTIEFHDVSPVEMDGFFHVLGCETEKHGSCERYNPISNEWSKVGTTNRESTFCCSVSLEGWIYAIGYGNPTDAKRSIEKYNPISNEWKDVAATRVVRRSIVATTLNGKIYAAGKDEEKNNVLVVEVYNPTQDMWTLAVFSPQPYCYLGLFTMDQTLIALRKSGYIPCNKGIEIVTFNFEKCKWVTAAKFEHSTLDPHPTLFCTKRLVGNYFVVIEAGEETTFCSLAQLAEKSDYFKALFANEFQEKREGKVAFHSLDPAAVMLCLRHIIEEYFPYEFDVINFSESLFHVARMFLLDDLVSFLSDYCGGLISIANFQVLRMISYKYDLVLLEEKCDEFAKDNLKEITEHECFVGMELDYVKYLLQSRRQKVELCRCNRSGLDCTESDIMKGLLAWVKHDDARKQYLPEFLCGVVNLSKVRQDALKEAIREPIIRDDRKILRRFNNAIKKRSRVHSVLLQKRFTQGTFHAYFPTEQKWKLTRFPAHPSTVIHCFNIEDDLYVVDDQKRLFSLRFSNPTSDWQEKAPLLLNGENFAFVTVENGLLYAFGENEAAKYDGKVDSWSPVEFFDSRSDFAIAAYQESIYIIGGREQQGGEDDGSYQILCSVLRFNTETEQWFDDVASMSEARYSLTAAQCAGKIYAIGGRQLTGLRSFCEEYDPVLNLWSRVACMKKLCSDLKAVTLGRSIFVLASSFRGHNRVAMIYHPENDTWKEKHIRMDLGRKSSVCISMPYDLIDE